MDELLNKTVVLEAPWLLVTAVSGALTIVGLLATSVFRMCLRALAPGEEAAKILDLLKTPGDWSVNDGDSLEHRTRKVEIDVLKKGGVCVYVDGQPVEHLLGGLDRRRIRKATLAVRERNEKDWLNNLLS